MEFLYKIRYAETDQMGIVHHANYLLYLEQARIEWLEKKGIEYHQLEKDGILMPVYDIHVKYNKPLTFGEFVKVKVECPHATRARVPFEYTLYNSSNELVVTAEVVLVFMSAEKRKPIKCPPELFNTLIS